MLKFSVFCGALLAALPAMAQMQASAPYTPSWQARHHLQWLSDHAGLQLITSHWPLPATAVEAALARLPRVQPDAVAQQVAWAREEVLRELRDRQEGWRLRAQARSRGEALNGFDDNYTPGSSVQIESEEWRWGQPADAFTAAVRVAESGSAWLSWMGPWSLDVFVAKAQDPQVVSPQASGFLFSGMRLTMKPQPWLEVGFSRGLQTGGAGRPGGVTNFVKAFFGQELNKNPEDTFADSSGQIAGYDLRVSCPVSWAETLGSCGAYTQWMGEDAAGKVPLPFKFMSLWGVESSFGQGRYRAFAEWANTNAYSLPWNSKAPFPGYVNGVYRQGYTQGARWVGSAQGSGAKVMTLGWMDAENLRVLKWHTGRIHTSLGAYDPRVAAPRGDFWAFSVTQTVAFKSFSLTPEWAYTRWSQAASAANTQGKNWRVGVMLDAPF